LTGDAYVYNNKMSRRRAIRQKITNATVYRMLCSIRQCFQPQGTQVSSFQVKGPHSSHRLTYGLLFRTHSSRKLNSDGPHPPTTSLDSFRAAYYFIGLCSTWQSPAVDLDRLQHTAQCIRSRSPLQLYCTVDAFEGENASEGGAYIVRIPLDYFRPCESGANGVPAARAVRHGGYTNHLSLYFPHFLSH